MKYLLLIILLTGCEQHATNDEIIKEAKKCTDAGMGYRVGDWGTVRCENPYYTGQKK